jgi:hypothetical protein
MSYFKYMGNVWYPLQDGTWSVQNDITKFVTIDPKYKSNPKYFIPYRIKDGDTPDILSWRLYQTTDFWWTVLIVNEIMDYSNDWPRTDDQLLDYINVNYRGQDPNEVLHYINLDGLITDLTAQKMLAGLPSISDNEIIAMRGLTPVTILEYETNQNDTKRNINMIDANYINEVSTQLEDLLNGN